MHRISLRRIQEVYEQIEKDNGRPLTDEAKADAIEMILDREALFLYGRELGLDRDPVVQRRLGTITRFVAEEREDSSGETEEIPETLQLGLLEGDSVIREIIIDGTKRLIRATALVRTPDEATMQRYLEENSSNYQLPPRTRLSQVTVNRNMHGPDTRARSEDLLQKLTEEHVDPARAGDFADPSLIDAHLPAMTPRALQRRFGISFVEALEKLPVGSWQGPLRSEIGDHLVFIHERIPQRTADLDLVREQVRSDLRNQIADQVLVARLRQLRDRYHLQVEQPPA